MTILFEVQAKASGASQFAGLNKSNKMERSLRSEACNPSYWESCLTIPASALAHWSHLCCKTCVALAEWENPIYLLGDNIVQLEVPASSSSGISFPVPLGRPNSNAMFRAV